MTLHEALEMITRGDSPRGYRVSFEERVGLGNILRSGYFPERDEKPFASEREAVALMELFAARAPARFVNLYIVDEKFSPVGNFDTRLVLRRY